MCQDSAQPFIKKEELNAALKLKCKLGNIEKVVCMKDEESFVKSIGGAGIKKIIVVGSSMVRNIGKVVCMKDEGSYVNSIEGAGIEQIMSEAVNAAESAGDDSVLFIQGGNNSLKVLGADRTVQSIVEGVREINGKNKKLWTVVLSLMPRPREDGRYERGRRRTNEILKEEIFKLFKEGIRVTLADIECMSMRCFASDGVHLNYEGNRVVRNEIINVVKRDQGVKTKRREIKDRC